MGVIDCGTNESILVPKFCTHIPCLLETQRVLITLFFLNIIIYIVFISIYNFRIPWNTSVGIFFKLVKEFYLVLVLTCFVFLFF